MANLSVLRKFDPNRYKKKDSTYDPLKQIEGLKKRLENVGVDPNKALDKRNFLEKALNLTPDQNTLFDIFEVINRPQQALFGAIRASQKGEDVGKGLLEGLTRKGENAEVRFKEILQAEGFEDSRNKIGLDDILGFAGDIFLDPVDLALIPVTGGANIAAQAADTAADAAKAVSKAQEAVDVARKAAHGLKKGKEVSERTKAFINLRKAKNTWENAQKAADIAKANITKEFISPLTAVGRGVKTGINKSVKLVDNGITRFLKYLDTSKAKELEKTTNILKATTTYKDFKHYLQGIFDAAKALPKGLWTKATKNLGLHNLTEAKLGVNQKILVDKIDNYAKSINSSTDEVGKKIMFVYEGTEYKPKTSFWELLSSKRNALNEQTAGEVRKIFNIYNKKLEDSWDFVKGDPTNKLLNFDDYFEKTTLRNGVDAYFPKRTAQFENITTRLEKIKDDLSKEIDAPRFISNDEFQEMKKLLADPNFKKVYDEFKNQNKQMFSILDEAYGTTVKFGKTEGYVRHKVNKDTGFEILNRLEKELPNLDVTKTSAFVKANSDAFTGRMYKMSAKEANDIVNAHLNLLDKKLLDAVKDKRELFTEVLQESTADFIGYANKFGKETQQIADVLVQGTFRNPEILRQAIETKPGLYQVPKGYQAIRAEKLNNRLKELIPFLEPNIAKAFEKTIKELPKKGTMAIDNNLLMWVGGVVENEQTNILVNMLDKINTLFKKTKLLSPGFQMRNFVGNSTNMYLAGMKPNDVMTYYKKADNIIRKGNDLLKKSIAKETLSETDKVTLSLYEEFIANNFHKVANELWEIPEDIVNKLSKEQKNNVIKKMQEIQEFNNKLNSETDKRFRLAMLMWAKENPSAYKKLGLDTPAEMVRRTLFDPNDLSYIEKNYMRRAIPFYTFAKKNLAYQMKNIVDNPKKYKNLQKTIRDIWESQDIENIDIDEYKKTNFWIPLPTTTKDGKYIAVKLNLPVGDLAEFMDDPLRRVISAMSPAIRVPFELTANKQLFSDMPIQDFKGQKGYIIPEMTRIPEYLLGASGLDVPVAGLFDVGRTAVNVAKGDLKVSSPFDAFDKTFGRSLFSSGDVEKTRMSKAYDEIKEIEDLMKLYKQKGIDIPKLADIDGKSKYLQRLKSRLEALNRMGS